MKKILTVLIVAASVLSAAAQTHPRLFFDSAELTTIRAKLDREPFKTMVAALEANKDLGDFYRPTNTASAESLLLRAQASAFLYALTGNESHATDCRSDVEAALTIIDAAGDWANSSLKGLTSYGYAMRTAICYDLCYNSTAWDATFNADISARLLSIATMIINNGGTEQNTEASSNWQANRASSGGLALLACDETYSSTLLDSAENRLNNFFTFNQGSNTRGWNPEGSGYTAYAWSFIGPYAIALDRLEPARSVSDKAGAKWMPWATFAGATTAMDVYGTGGVKTDWSDDNAHCGGEGVYGFALRFCPPELLPGLRHAYDRFQGSLCPNGANWDAVRHGTFWSILYYPEDVPAQDPLEIFDWQDANVAPVQLGVMTFRDGYRDENDILVQFKARTFQVQNTHDGADGLGFRILGPGDPFVIGGGRNNPARDQNQATVYPNNPNTSPSTNKNQGTFHGTPLVKPDGSGHAIASMGTSNVGTTNHKRWIVTDFDRAATGADATVIVADTSDNGSYWQLPTFLDNTVNVIGNIFTISGTNGATLQGTIIHPGGTPTVTVGTKPRGDGYSVVGGGTLVGSPPRVTDNRYLFIENPADGDFLVVMTIQQHGGRHPVAARTSGGVSDAVIEVGSRTYSLQADNVLYDGSAFTQPDATVTFVAGPNGSVSGSTVQVVAHGGAAAAPTVTPDSGFAFAGWDKAFNEVAVDMTVTALFEPDPGPASLLTFEASSYRIDENGGTIDIGVTRTGSLSGAAGVSYATSDHSATAGADYTAASGTLSWADGEADTKFITVTLTDDGDLEGDESFTISLSAPTGGAALTAPATTTVTLTDDEVLPPLPLLALTSDSHSVDENGGSLTIDVARYVETAGAVSVDYAVTVEPGDTATAGADFTAVSGTLSWADGESGLKSFVIPILDDGLVEADETFTVTLSDPTGGGLLGAPSVSTATILEDEVNLPPSIVIDRPSGGIGALGAVGQRLDLAATTTDDGLPGPLAFQWAKLSGPGTVTFGDAASEDTWASFDTAGVYQVTLTADDGLLQDTATVLVNVDAAGTVTQRLAQFGFPHASGTPPSFAPDVIGADLGLTDATVTGALINQDNANVLQLGESGGTGGMSTNYSDTTNIISFRLDADPGFFFDLTAASAPKISLQLARLSSASGVNPVARVQIWGDTTGPATTASTLVHTSGEVTATSTSAVTLDETAGIPGIDDTNRYTSLLVQVQWKSNLSNSWGNFTFDNIILDGAVVPIVDNVGPVVDAGPDTTVQVNTPLALAGSASDDGLPTASGAVTLQWSKLAGPGNVSFGDATDPATTATFDASGNYVLSLAADDGAIGSSDTVSITVTTDAPTPPAAPSDLNASAVSHQQIDLSWTDNASDETGFRILRSNASGSGFSEIDTASADATSYSDTSVAPETAYFYEVVATNTNGDSASSNEASATTPAAPPPMYGTIQLSAASYSVDENGGSVTIIATRTGGSDGTAGVSYATGDDSAVAGTDYVAASGTLEWPAGDSTDKSFTVTIIDNGDFTGDRSFLAGISTPTGGATLGAITSAPVTIVEDDVDPVPTITIDRPSGGSARLVNVGDRLVLDSNPMLDGSPVSVPVFWTQLGGPGTATFEDDTAADTTVVFDASGSYQLRVTYDTGTQSASADLTVDVATPPPASGELVRYEFPGSTTADKTPTSVTTGYSATDVVLSGLVEQGQSNQVKFDGIGSSYSDYVGFTLSSGSPIDLNGGTVAFFTDFVNGNRNNRFFEVRLISDGTTVTLAERGGAADSGAEQLNYTSEAISGLPASTSIDVRVYWKSSETWGDQVMDNLRVTASLVSNDGPVTNAGPDDAATAGTPLSLAGSATDDGFPAPSAALSYLWTQLSGPGATAFGDATNPTTQATFPSAGTYTLRLTAFDGAIATADDAVFTVTGGGLTPIESWRQTWFGTTANSGDAADDFDFDQDGLDNLLEYPLGLNPTQPDGSPVTGDRALDGRLRISFSRDPGATDVTITVQASDGLGGWDDLAESVNGTAFTALVVGSGIGETPNGGLIDVVITDPQAAETSDTRFMRLSVTRP